MGAVVASGLPDLDVVFPLFGFSKRFHRAGSHSLLLIGIFLILAWVLTDKLGVRVDRGTLLAWSAALLSHPFFDVITTGPKLGALGWGIPLYWPISSRRFWVTWPILGDRDEGLTVRDQLREMGEDLVRVVPVCAVTILVTLLWR
jgi:membrane-bound metal-dependent hydrolase YbcI (DUF457 family)